MDEQTGRPAGEGGAGWAGVALFSMFIWKDKDRFDQSGGGGGGIICGQISGGGGGWMPDMMMPHMTPPSQEGVHVYLSDIIIILI